MNSDERISAACPGNVIRMKGQLPADTFTGGGARYLKEIARQIGTRSTANELGILADSRMGNTGGGTSNPQRRGAARRTVSRAPTSS
jgi:hypothetical protein